ncbi:proline rich transmembrane protein 1B-like [Saccostrea echinata]|uniref:proline rich transmembrane protein 1B-like n=1 Tax=Saccostrea echinata TaxID=191078 RepID=UPI002A7FAA1A|nr:proline rich transmembrane protein 1B-like [Saccostrea echinata]
MQFGFGGYQNYDAEQSDREKKRLKKKEPETGLADQFGYILTSPKDYKAEAIFATIFCCLPIGLVALFYSTRVKHHYKNNRLIAAYSSSKVAQVLSIVATLIGLLLWLAGVIALVVLK